MISSFLVISRISIILSDLNFLSVNYEKMGVSYCCKKLEMNKKEKEQNYTISK
jgi:hypothetical protein